MDANKLADILNNLCNMFIDDGQVPEEVIELMIDAGCNRAILKDIGFTDDQLKDYAYYESAMSGRPEEEILVELGE